MQPQQLLQQQPQLLPPKPPQQQKSTTRMIIHQQQPPPKPPNPHPFPQQLILCTPLNKIMYFKTQPFRNFIFSMVLLYSIVYGITKKVLLLFFLINCFANDHNQNNIIFIIYNKLN